jgi:ABC-2 type transport system ATP-binding protein
MSDAIEVDGLRVRRGTFTLEVPRWRVAAGTVVGVVGANGAGKSTLLELLPGFYATDEGSVRVAGLDPAADPVGVRQVLGFMTDDLPLPAGSVSRLLWTLSGYWPTWDGDLVRGLLDRFEIDPGASVGTMSKGEGTRLRLVLAMAFRPKVLVLDEPATGLDVHGRRALLKTVLEVVQDPGRAVIISSHDLADVERICDRLLVLHRGRVLNEGPTADLVGDHRTLEEAVLQWSAS